MTHSLTIKRRYVFGFFFKLVVVDFENETSVAVAIHWMVTTSAATTAFERK